MRDKNIKNLIEALLKSSKGTKGITFINKIDEEDFFSYKELLKESERVLQVLKGNGICEGQEALLVFQSIKEFIITFWACLLGKIIPVPLVYPKNQEEIEKILNIWDTLKNPFLLYDDKRIIEKFKAFNFHENTLNNLFSKSLYRNVDEDKEKFCPTNVHINDYKPNDIAFIQFSSGSTGTPKGVVVTHENIICNALDLLDKENITENDSFLSWKPITHDFGIIAFHLTPIVANSNQFRMDTKTFIWNPNIWLSSASKHKVTILGSPNFGYQHLLNGFKKEIASAEGWDLSNVRVILNGAELISNSICNKFCSVLEEYGLSKKSMKPGYGLAENTLVVAVSSDSEEMKSYFIDRNNINVGDKVIFAKEKQKSTLQLMDCGTTLKNTLIRITDNEFNELMEDVVGHICIKGKSLTSGYYNNTEATQKVITGDGWLDTGDLGFTHNGRVVIIGRIKEVIIINGINYYPQDLERVIVDKIDEIKLNEVVACGVYNNDSEKVELVIFIHFKKELSGFIPLVDKVKKVIEIQCGVEVSYVLPIRSIPKTTSGKIKRFYLEKNFEEGAYNNILKNINDLVESKTIDSREIIIDEIEKIVGTRNIDKNKSLFELGLSSIQLINLQKVLKKKLNLDWNSTKILEYPSVNALISSINNVDNNEEIPCEYVDDNEDIAVIGMALRMPNGINSKAKYFNALINEENLITDYPKDRFKFSQENLEELSSEKGGFLEDIDKFDPLFFGISQKEAMEMDPQQRILLELTWEAFEDAGMNPIDNNYSNNTGVFIGLTSNDYIQVGRDCNHGIGPYSFTGSMFNSAAGRLSYIYNLQGPSIAVDTACSSSITAIRQSILELNSGSCDVAIVGAANCILRPEACNSFSKLGAISKDGRCKSFEDNADGYVRSEGGVVILLKKISLAKKDGDDIWGVIKSAVINHNGHNGGLTVPSSEAQKKVIKEALKKAKLKPDDISYIEAHGSGTKIGDPQEANTLIDVFKTKKDPLFLGCVKSNLGHLEAAAGLAGICKVLLAFKYGVLPKNYRFSTENTLVDWKNGSLKIVKENINWNNENGIRRAGVSSFGISGTNGHLILEDYISEKNNNDNYNNSFLCPVSANSETALKEYIKRLTSISNKDINMTDFSQNLCVARASLKYRTFIVAESFEDFKKKMLKKTKFNEIDDNDKKIIFAFSGQGSNYVGMARELFNNNNVFRDSLIALSEKFQKYINRSIIDVIYYSNEETLLRPLYSQVSIFAIQVALVEYWASMGIKPDMVVGHSIGEYAATYIAGIINLDDAVKLVAMRAQIMDETNANGKMITILTSIDEVKEEISKYNNVSIAAINATENITVSGNVESVKLIEKSFKSKKVFVESLKISHPYHSKLMEDGKKKFLELVKAISFDVPQMKMYSTMTGEEITKERPLSVEYFANHLINTVLFSKTIKNIIKNENAVFLEIGAQATLGGLIAQNSSNALVFPSLRRNFGDEKSIYFSLGALWQIGFKVNFKGMFNKPYNRIENMPHTPFDRKSVWFKEYFLKEENSKNELIKENESVNPINKSISVIDWTIEVISEVTALGKEDLSPSEPFTSFGMDSLMFVQLGKRIKEKYILDISIKSLFMELNTINTLSKYISENYKEKDKDVEIVEDNISKDFIKEVINKQLAIMESQVELLKSMNNSYIHSSLDNSELTSEEKPVYILSKLKEGNKAYHIIRKIKLSGEIDEELLWNSLISLCKKHELLRTGYEVIDNKIVHRLSDKTKVNFKKYDFRIDNDIEDFKKEFFKEFSLENPPLWRVALVKDNEEEWLYLCFHHIISDDYSVELFTNELEKSMNKEALQQNTSSYCELVDKENNIENRDYLKNWWNNYLTPLPNKLSIKTIGAKNGLNDFNGSSIIWNIENDEYKNMKNLIKDYKVTPFNFFLGVWFILFGKLGNSNDFCIATPYDLRQMGDFSNSFGMFARTLLIRCKQEMEDEFEEFLKKVNENTFNTFEKAGYSFESILEDLNLSKGFNDNPLFSIMFTYVSSKKKTYDFNSIKGEMNYIGCDYTTFDINIGIEDEDERFKIKIDYSISLYDENIVLNWIKDFKNIIYKLSKNPNMKLKEICAIDEMEKKKLLRLGEGNNLNVDNISLDNIMNNSYSKYGKLPAISYKGKEISYSELNEKVNLYSSYLMKLGINDGDIVGILLPSSPNNIILMLAIRRIGGTWLNMDIAFPKERIEYMIEKSNCKAIIGEETILNSYKHLTRCISINYVENSNEVIDLLKNVNNKLAYIIFTSGSTGNPKGVKLPESALVNFILSMSKELNWEINKKVACMTSPSFDIYLLETFLVLANGGCIVIADKMEGINPDNISKFILDYKIDYLQITPSRLKMIAIREEAASKIFSFIKAIFIGGEQFPSHLLEYLKSFNNLRIYNVYGPTETCIWSTVKELTNSNKVTIGKPIGNTYVYILDDEGRLLQEGKEGNLWIGGKGLALGYIKDEANTKKRFHKNPFNEGYIYNTGDRAKWDNNELICLGRSDFQIKLRGYRIELEEIENVIIKLRNIENVAVVTRSIGMDNNEVLVAYYTLKNNTSLNKDELIGWIKGKLPDYMVPSYLIELDKMPLTQSGKIDRNNLPNTLVTQNIEIDSKNESIINTVDIYSKVRGIWEKVLGRKDFADRDSFFDVGGNSFNLVLLFNELDLSFKNIFVITDLFSNSTVESIVNFISSKNSKLMDDSIKVNGNMIIFDNGKSDYFNISISTDLSKKILKLYNENKKKINEFLLSLYSIYLNKTLNLDKINLWSIEGEEDGHLISVDFNNNTDLNQILDYVSHLIQNNNYTDYKKLNESNVYDKKIRIAFVDENIDQESLVHAFNIIINISVKENKIQFKILCNEFINIKECKNEFIKYLSLVKYIVD